MNPPARLHVVAGVLRDAAGRVLVARRPRGDALAGLWEFPGGKCEPGETPQQALRRELAEELDVSLGEMSPLHAVPWPAPGKPLLLDAYEVEAFAGVPRAHVHDALQWLDVSALRRADMPPADWPIVAALRLPRHYAITPEPKPNDIAGFLRAFSSCLDRGARLLQLRAKNLPDAPLEALALQCRELAHARGAKLLVNDRIALAVRLRLDGVHLSAARARGLVERCVGDDLLLGVSCHDAVEVAQAQRLSCDFACIGSVNATPSHEGIVPMGWSGFAALARESAAPVFALGGMDAAMVATARAHHGFGIAAIRAFWRDD